MPPLHLAGARQVPPQRNPRKPHVGAVLDVVEEVDVEALEVEVLDVELVDEEVVEGGLLVDDVLVDVAVGGGVLDDVELDVDDVELVAVEDEVELVVEWLVDEVE